MSWIHHCKIEAAGSDDIPIRVEPGVSRVRITDNRLFNGQHSIKAEDSPSFQMAANLEVIDNDLWTAGEEGVMIDASNYRTGILEIVGNVLSGVGINIPDYDEDRGVISVIGSNPEISFDSDSSIMPRVMRNTVDGTYSISGYVFRDVGAVEVSSNSVRRSGAAGFVFDNVDSAVGSDNRALVPKPTDGSSPMSAYAAVRLKNGTTRCMLTSFLVRSDEDTTAKEWDIGIDATGAATDNVVDNADLRTTGFGTAATAGTLLGTIYT